MLSLRLNVGKLPDPDEIRRFMENAGADVLVGFPSGKQHVQTLHRKDRDSPYEGLGGGEPDLVQVEDAELAKRLSFGDADVPARPFLEDGIDSKRDKLEKEIGEQLESVRAGKSANWAKVGTMAVGAVQEFVRGDTYKRDVPNSKKTIEWKGSDTPLIDGGDLINSLEFVVE